MDIICKPDGMNIELTNCCPLRCPQCYCSLEGGKHIPPEVAIRAIEQGAALGVTHVELSGGETLCYPHLLELVEARTLRELAGFVSAKLSTLEQVTGTATSFVLKRYKEEGVIFEGEDLDRRLVISP